MGAEPPVNQRFRVPARTIAGPATTLCRESEKKNSFALTCTRAGAGASAAEDGAATSAAAATAASLT